jgi:hypothetical protein
MQAFGSDHKLQEEYYGKIFKEFEQFKDDKFYYNYINSAIKDIFEKFYIDNLNKVYEKSAEAQSLDKRRMLIKVKKMMYRSRIIQHVGEEILRT